MNPATSVLDLHAVNNLGRDAFVATLGATFEHAAWVAEAAYSAGPFESLAALHEAMMRVVRTAPRTTQLAFLCGHPELAGREAQAGGMTLDSQREQASAGIDAMTRDEVVAMAALNAQYRKRHGFPFIIAARRHTKAQIFDELRRRIDEPTSHEFVEAMEQIACITRLRLRALLAA